MNKIILTSALFFLIGCSQEDSVLNGEKLFLQGEYEDALRILEPLANNGNSSAQFLVGKAYDLGLFVDIDKDKAREYYTKASDTEPKAKINLANMFISIGSERYKRRAMLMYEEAMDEEPIAYLNYFFNRIKEASTLEQANSIILEVEKEAEFGDVGANYTLGWFNLFSLMHPTFGPIIQKDSNKAKRYLEKIKSNDRALDLLLSIYVSEEDSNYKELFITANRLSKLGYPNSKAILGVWYFFGKESDKKVPVNQDYELGREYLFQAAELYNLTSLPPLTNALDGRIEKDVHRFKKIAKRNGDYIRAAYAYSLGPERFVDQTKQGIDFLNAELKQNDNSEQKNIWLQAALAKSLLVLGQKEEAYELANKLIKSAKKDNNFALPNIYFVICNQDIENQNLKKADKSCLAGDYSDSSPRPNNLPPFKDSQFFYTMNSLDPITMHSIASLIGLHSLVSLSINNPSTKSIVDDIERLSALEKTQRPPVNSLTQVSISRLYSSIADLNQGLNWGLKAVNSDTNSSYAKQVLIQAFLNRGSTNDIENAMRIAHDLAQLGESVSTSAGANNHIVWAQSLIGVNYYSGKYLEKDLKQAKYWLTNASDSGSVVATGNLGILHLWTEEYKDIQKAEELLIKAINNGNNYFERALGEMYVLGLSGSEIFRTKQNYDKGLEMLNNYITANDQNFDRLFAGYFADSFYEGAIDEIEPFCKLTKYSADNGDAIGLMFKGVLHLDKDCDFVNYYNSHAVKDMEKAYRLGSNTAAFLLGNFYRDGEYQKENLELSEYYYDKAEELFRTRKEDNFISLMLNSYTPEEINTERLELNSKIRIAEAEKRKEVQRVAQLKAERERKREAERRRQANASETPFLDFLGGVLKVAAVVAAADFVIDNADVIAEAMAQSAQQDYDWDWDYFRSNGQWRCRGIQTGRFADNSNCIWDRKDDDRWPYN